jgi:PGF-pre-PGF domain-containing protein
VVAPNVSLVSPANASTWSSSSTITFSYNVTDDNNIKNCSLIINNATEVTDTSITKNTTQSFSKSLSNANYNWSINCYDSLDNQGNSSTYSLIVSYTAPSSSGSSGGGGSDSGGGAPISKISKNIRTKTWFKVFKNKAIDWNIKDFVIKFLSLKPKTASSNAMITIVLFDKKPEEVTELENVYKYVKIRSDNLEAENIKIEFKVENEWLVKYDKDNVVLSKFTKKWIDLPTTYLKSDINYSYYESQSDSFSYFGIRVIGKQKPEVEEEIKDVLEEEIIEPKEELGEEQPEQIKEVVEERKSRLWVYLTVIIVLVVVGLLIGKYRLHIRKRKY